MESVLSDQFHTVTANDAYWYPYSLTECQIITLRISFYSRLNVRIVLQ